jgi:HSP20 family protein
MCDQPQSRFVTATFEPPGLKKEEIGIHLTHDGRLTISGYRQSPPFLANTDPASVVYSVKEIKYGRFERTINVPASLEVYPLVWLRHMERSELGALTRLIQVKDINASLADDLLCVSWPRTVSPVLPQGPTQVISMA